MLKTIMLCCIGALYTEQAIAAHKSIRKEKLLIPLVRNTVCGTATMVGVGLFHSRIEKKKYPRLQTGVNLFYLGIGGYTAYRLYAISKHYHLQNKYQKAVECAPSSAILKDLPHLKPDIWNIVSGYLENEHPLLYTPVPNLKICEFSHIKSLEGDNVIITEPIGGRYAAWNMRLGARMWHGSLRFGVYDRLFRPHGYSVHVNLMCHNSKVGILRHEHNKSRYSCDITSISMITGDRLDTISTQNAWYSAIMFPGALVVSDYQRHITVYDFQDTRNFLRELQSRKTISHPEEERCTLSPLDAEKYFIALSGSLIWLYTIDLNWKYIYNTNYTYNTKASHSDDLTISAYAVLNQKSVVIGLTNSVLTVLLDVSRSNEIQSFTIKPTGIIKSIAPLSSNTCIIEHEHQHQILYYVYMLDSNTLSDQLQLPQGTKSVISLASPGNLLTLQENGDCYTGWSAKY